MPESLLPRRVPLDAPLDFADRSLLAGFGIRAAVVCSVPLAMGLLFLAAEDAFEVRSSVAATLVAVAALGIMSLLALGLRDLRAAEARTAVALDRAGSAEKAERARADELANVLRASQSLRLASDGKVDYMFVLAAITPAGATSFLVRSGALGGSVEAAHGPLAPMVMSARAAAASGRAPGDRAVRSYGSHGKTAGLPVGPGHMQNVEPIESALAIPLVGHDGRDMGSLHMIDPAHDRVLDPTFVAMAQLVANQIAVAMENDDLLFSLRHQLAEVQRVQQQLVQASKLGAIGELAAAVAHEVNNPLTGILGFSELLLDGLPAGDARRAEVAIIREQAIRARDIVRALLDFARPRSPHRVDTDLNAIARSAVDLVRYRAQEAHITIHEEYGELPTLELDPDSFKQVVLNLCTNGIEAMPDGGELSLTTLTADAKVGMVVGDTGVGMDRTTRNRIFTPFFSSRMRGGYGTGLGLAVSLNIVEGHGGSIDVQSEPGKGSTFTVWLPTQPSTEQSPSDAGRAISEVTGAEVAA